MSKTIVIDDDVHAIIIEEQSRMRDKYDINLKISYIASCVLKCYTHKIEDILKREILKKGSGVMSEQEIMEKVDAS